MDSADRPIEHLDKIKLYWDPDQNETAVP